MLGELFQLQLMMRLIGKLVAQRVIERQNGRFAAETGSLFAIPSTELEGETEGFPGFHWQVIVIWG